MARTLRLYDGTWTGLIFIATDFSRLVEGEADRALAIVGLSASSFVALYEISKAPPTAQRHLATRLRLLPSTVSELLKRLQRRGLIQRAPGRPRAVSLTEAGRATLERAEQVMTRLETSWSERLTQRGDLWPGCRARGLERFLSESYQSLAASAPPTIPSAWRRPSRIRTGLARRT